MLLHPLMSLVVSPWFAGRRQFCAVLFTLWLKELVAIKGWVSKYQNLKQLHLFIFVFKDFAISVYLIGSGTKIKCSDINTLEPATENQRLSFIVFWKSYFQDEISMENLLKLFWLILYLGWNCFAQRVIRILYSKMWSLVSKLKLHNISKLIYLMLDCSLNS